VRAEIVLVRTRPEIAVEPGSDDPSNVLPLGVTKVVRSSRDRECAIERLAITLCLSTPPECGCPARHRGDPANGRYDNTQHHCLPLPLIAAPSAATLIERSCSSTPISVASQEVRSYDIVQEECRHRLGDFSVARITASLWRRVPARHSDPIGFEDGDHSSLLALIHF
jgi:hypothetical protein